MEFWLNVLFFCCIHRSTSSLALLLMSVIGLTVIYNLTGHIDTTYQNYFQIANSGLLRGWSSFVLGIIAYRGWRLARTIEWSPMILLLAECVLCISVLALFFARGGNLSLLDIFAPFVFTALVVVFALEQGILARLVAKLQWLGTISYSIYLNDLIILMVIDGGLVHLGLSHAQLTPLYLGGLLAYSAITYRWVETTGKRLITKLSITPDAPHESDDTLKSGAR